LTAASPDGATIAGMMTQELNVCVLAAPLAAIDRRALSQAWYSALHCASGKSRPAPRPNVRDAGYRRNGSAAQPAPPEHSEARSGARTTARRENAKTQDPSVSAEIDRRARRSPLARHIERTFLDPRAMARRATFITGGKRVHVVVQASAGRVRLVAVCAPAIRETVARALAQARFALASRGIACS
jgi:hypothetical protein